MSADLPDKIVEHLGRFLLSRGGSVFLFVDANGRLLDKGGELASIELPDWQVGQNLLDEIIFLRSFLPMQNDTEFLPTYQLGENCVLDVHLFADPGGAYVVLLDRTGDIEWEARARQLANEMKLLQQKVRLQQEWQAGTADAASGFFESLNMMALRANQDESFSLLHSASERFLPLYPESFEATSPLFPQRKFEFLGNFIFDAAEIWRDPDNPRRLRSGPWIETDRDGTETALEAIALNWRGQHLLFIEILDENYQLNHSFLQVGREGELLKRSLQQEVRRQTAVIRAREEEIVLRLVCAADSRDDGETGSHIRRLGLYSELMAFNLGWSSSEADEIRIAASMHDIGKIGIPDHILRKPGQLTESEFEIMKLHPEIGARILSNSDSTLVQMARDISLGHHEKWDGSGYPHGLSGEDIPVSARIVAIVDVFDALIHKRVYKDEVPVDRAVELMREGRGLHFDPELLDLFFELGEQMTEIAFDFSNPIGDEPPDETGIIADIHRLRPTQEQPH